MSTAAAITHVLAAKGIRRTSPSAIYLVLTDGPHTTCFTESMLDTWWHELSPEQKAEVCENFHDGPTEPNLYNQPLPMLRSGVAEFVGMVEAIDQRATQVAAAHRAALDRDFQSPYVRYPVAD